MIKRGLRGRVCHSVHRHAKANNKYMEDYDKNKQSSYIMYVDTNTFYGFAMSQKLPTKNFTFLQEISVIDEDFIKNYDEDSDVGCILEVDIEYPKHLHSLSSDLPFLLKRMKINGCKKLVCNLYYNIKIIKASIKPWTSIKKDS